ncbi:hypothetical protein NHQ30_004403 [Ciborinia camelliae]|nr:hypothetical protein NHQ30_004403 [Ciborinia camelliae]
MNSTGKAKNHGKKEELEDVENNIRRADAIISKSNLEGIDLLVLPEMAFSGYNFSSLEHITPHLELTTAGITSLWARKTALKHNCIVAAGYPEKVVPCTNERIKPEYYNSLVTMNREGETIVNYRKSFLYYTDETWAHEGSGFFSGNIDGLGNVAMGICMDLNPYKFQTEWSDYEFATHILHKKANLVILSMAWLTTDDQRSFNLLPNEPDMETISYWLARLEPVLRAETAGEIIIVLANRCGSEDHVTYAGTSAVLGIKDGVIKVYGRLGRGEEKVLIVDTDEDPRTEIVLEPRKKDWGSANN